MRSLVVAVTVLAVGRAAHADPAGDEQAVRAAAKALLTALGNHDDAAIKAAFAPTVALALRSYGDTSCEPTYRHKKSIKRAATPALAACLYSIGTLPEPDVAVTIKRAGRAFDVTTDPGHTYRFRKRGTAFLIERVSGDPLAAVADPSFLDDSTENSLDHRK